MYDFHSDKVRYFDIQYRVTKEYILPYIKSLVPGKKWSRVLEIGSAEAGVLKCFLEEGSFCTGIELSSGRVEYAEKFHAEALKEGRIEFINRNIFDIDPVNDLGGLYDLIILKDVIEHIPGQKEFMQQLPSFLNPGGYIFFAFPPWQMPYGGHQQVCKNKFLSKLPYFHLLPKLIYKGILMLGGEQDSVIQDLLDVKSTGISIERFERCLKFNGLHIVGRRHFFINPIYQYKFNMRPRIQARVLSVIPWLRNFYTTCSYYLVRAGK